jgi:hypothetical protein
MLAGLIDRFPIGGRAVPTTQIAAAASSTLAVEHCQVKWTRFTVGNASDTKTRAEPMAMETALEAYAGPAEADS